MSRDEDIERVVEVGRQTRTPTPRWLWIAAAVVGAICVVGLGLAILREHPPARRPLEHRPEAGRGFGIGLVLGVAVGIPLGMSIARQRSQASRSTP